MIVKFTIFLYILAFSFTSCYVPKEIKLSIPQPIENISSAKKCKASVFDYASHSNSVHAIPERKIKLHFYIVDNKEGTNNFNREDGERYIKDLIRAANNKLTIMNLIRDAEMFSLTTHVVLPPYPHSLRPSRPRRIHAHRSGRLPEARRAWLP